MKINQLFRRVPDVEILNELCRCMGLGGIDDGRGFTRSELQRRGAAELVKAMPKYQELKECYIPCKRRLYIDTFESCTNTDDHYKNPEHRLLVILRHLLRLHGRRLATSEHTWCRGKYIRYHIVRIDEQQGGAKVVQGRRVVDMS